MPRQPSWQEIATLLGQRMRHHAWCDEHPATAPDPDDCPFCADRAAYQAYTAKAGIPTPKPTPPGDRISLSDLQRQHTRP